MAWAEAELNQCCKTAWRACIYIYELCPVGALTLFSSSTCTASCPPEPGHQALPASQGPAQLSQGPRRRHLRRQQRHPPRSASAAVLRLATLARERCQGSSTCCSRSAIDYVAKVESYNRIQTGLDLGTDLWSTTEARSHCSRFWTQVRRQFYPLPLLERPDHKNR